MSTCARCGLPETECGANEPPIYAKATIACRDRELANLRALLRSVTRELELAGDYLASRDDDSLLLPLQSINKVLEALS